MKTSLRAIDVGFDLRRHPEIEINHDPKYMQVDYDGPNNERMTATGSPDEIAATLRAAGYSIKDAQ